jgi:hypothetical protein
MADLNRVAHRLVGERQFRVHVIETLGHLNPDVPTGDSTTTDPLAMPMASMAIGYAGPRRSASVSCFLTRRLSDQLSPSRRR